MIVFAVENKNRSDRIIENSFLFIYTENDDLAAQKEAQSLLDYYHAKIYECIDSQLKVVFLTAFL